MSNKLFNKLTTDNLEESQDRLGGFNVQESGIYMAEIKTAYAGQSQGGAQFINFIFSLENGSEYRETVYITDKNGKNYFLNKQDNTKKVALPGFKVADDICLIVTGEPLCNQETEDKTVKVWDTDSKSEVPKSVPCLTALHNQKVALAIMKELQNKSEKQGNEYVPTAETREQNTISKVFHPEMRITVAEALKNETEPKFWHLWADKYTGQVTDRRTIKDGSTSAPKASTASTAKAPSKSLFSKN